MKTYKALVLLLAAVLILAACGRQEPPPDNDDPVPGTGTLVVNVTDADGDPVAATIRVTTAAGVLVDEKEDVDTFTWPGVDVGNYVVTVSADGFQTATKPAAISADQTTTVDVVLTAIVDPVAEEGVLDVLVNVPATINVTGEGVDETFSGNGRTWTVPAGDYTVSVSAPGYADQSAVFEVPAGETVYARFTLIADDIVVGNVANVEVTRFFDVAGDDYDTNDEINPVKEAILIAAQTEELVGIEIKVTDVDGQAVQGAPVTLSVTGLNLIVAVYAGKPTDVVSSAATFGGVVTDAQGMAYFTLEATYALDSLNQYFEDGLNINQEPAVKVLVSAVGGDNLVKRAEFKAYFVNMSHLWYWGSPYFGGRDQEDVINLEYAEERLGGVVGPFTNIWMVGEDNRHEFDTVALVKQPTSGPHQVGSPHGNVDWDLFDGRFPGYVRYEIIDVSEDADGNPLVLWEDWPDNCNWMNRPAADLDPLVCESGAGPVALLPVDGLALDDLPISATVKATYVFVTEYGEQVATGSPNRYEFELKDYTFTKFWVGGFLEIDKYVDQHVLTWHGPQQTMPAQQTTAQMPEDFRSTVYITVTNPSDSILYGTNIVDALPAELGVVSGRISNGGTYDAVNHTITWLNLPNGGDLAPGDPPIVVSFDVYARQKPGYTWDGTVGTGGYVVQPIHGDTVPYQDPYRVVNGGIQGRVVANARFGPDVRLPEIQFGYLPVADESDIWVVRPFFDIAKTRLSPSPIEQLMSSTFELEAMQIDRVDTGEYAFLAQRYPWEFGGDLADAPAQWHVAPQSQENDNPVAHTVRLSDFWQDGLDFTNGTQFAVDGAGAQIFPGSTQVVGKSVIFDAAPGAPISRMYRGETWTATLQLQGNLPGEWTNCLYLGADQLNQPYRGLTEDEVPNLGPAALNLVYPTDRYPTMGTLAGLWLKDQIDNEYVFASEGAGPGGFPSRTSANVLGRIEACANVTIAEGPPGEIELSTHGEFDRANSAPELGSPVFRTYDPGDEFIYKFTATNTGGSPVFDVALDFSIIDPGVVFDGTAALYRGTPGNWNLIQTTSWTGTGDQAFAPVDILNSNQSLRMVIFAAAVNAGDGVARMQVTVETDPEVLGSGSVVVEATTIRITGSVTIGSDDDAVSDIVGGEADQGADSTAVYDATSSGMLAGAFVWSVGGFTGDLDASNVTLFPATTPANPSPDVSVTTPDDACGSFDLTAQIGTTSVLATITVNVPCPTAVVVEPETATVDIDSTVQVWTTVSVTTDDFGSPDHAPQAVTWSIGNCSAGVVCGSDVTVDPVSGMVTVVDDGSLDGETFDLIATSVADPTLSDSIEVTIENGV